MANSQKQQQQQKNNTKTYVYIPRGKEKETKVHNTERTQSKRKHCPESTFLLIHSIKNFTNNMKTRALR